MNYAAKVRLIIVGTILMVVLASASAQSGNLIVNGSFEQQPSLAGWTLSHDYIYPFWKRPGDFGGENLFPGNYDNPIGTTSSRTREWMVFNAHQGAMAVNVHSVSLYQIVDLVPGQEYRLSFWVGSYDDGRQPADVSGWGGLDLAVFQGHNLRENLSPLFAGNQIVPTGVDLTWYQYLNYTPGSHTVNWLPFAYTFLASADQAALVFQGGAYSFSQYTGLDDVSLMPLFVESDFNNDGLADVVLQHQDGFLGVWFMNKGRDRVSANFFSPSQVDDAHWRIVATQDFNGDKEPDLLFQHQDGTLAVWYMNGIDLVSAELLNPSQPGKSWRVVGTGDLDRDGKTDILFQHTDGTLAVWFMDGINLIQRALLNPNHPGDSRWRVVGTADLTLTGNTDLIFQNTDGTLAAWYMDGTKLVRPTLLNPATPAEKGWRVAATLDFNRDGKTDLLFQHDEGRVAVWLMDGINLISGQLLPENPGVGWRIMGPR